MTLVQGRVFSADPSFLKVDELRYQQYPAASFMERKLSNMMDQTKRLNFQWLSSPIISRVMTHLNMVTTRTDPAP